MLNPAIKKARDAAHARLAYFRKMTFEGATTMTMKRYNFFMHIDIYEALGKAAERRRVSRSQLLRDILVKVLRLDAPPTDERLLTRATAPETSERVAERVD